MNTAKPFTNGRSQAAQLPKENHFRGKDVFIKRIGDIVLLPHSRSSLYEYLDALAVELVIERAQPAKDACDGLLQ